MDITVQWINKLKNNMYDIDPVVILILLRYLRFTEIKLLTQNMRKPAIITHFSTS